MNDLPLHRAATAGRTQAVELLLDRGANLRARSDKAVIETVIGGHLSMVKLLLDRGANVQVNNESPLRLAAAYGRLDIVKLFIERGANPMAVDLTTIETKETRDFVEMCRAKAKSTLASPSQPQSITANNEPSAVDADGMAGGPCDRIQRQLR